MSIITYPLNEVDYDASDAELFHCTRSSGIYANDDFDFSATGTDSNITIGTGIGWIRNSKFAGKVIAQKSATVLDLGVADATYPRIDAVVIQFDAATNQTVLIVKNGVAASSPVPPEVVRTESQYELHLYHVRRTAGTAAVTPSDVIDLRMDTSYCGLMADSVTQIDTEAIRTQIAVLINDLETEIAAVKDSTAFCTKEYLTGELENYAESEHIHDASDINSGILALKRGGTGGETRNDGFTNLAFLGTNPVTVDTDTPTAWIALGNGFAGTTTVCTNYQSDTYGTIINMIVQDYNVHQIFVGLNGNLFFRGGSKAQGWIYRWRAVLPKSGGEMTGAVTLNGIHLTEGVDYGDTFPEDAEVGRLFWIPVVSTDG